MGVIADAVLNGGGRVVGVIPEALASKEVKNSLAELHVVADMHPRKALLGRRADAFLTLPAGVEEFFETLTRPRWRSTTSRMGVLNVAGYFDPLLRCWITPSSRSLPPRRLGRSRGDRRGSWRAVPGQPPSAEDRFRVEWLMARIRRTGKIMAMLKRLMLKGFKSIEEMDLELHPLNVLIAQMGPARAT